MRCGVCAWRTSTRDLDRDGSTTGSTPSPEPPRHGRTPSTALRRLVVSVTPPPPPPLTCAYGPTSPSSACSCQSNFQMPWNGRPAGVATGDKQAAGSVPNPAVRRVPRGAGAAKCAVRRRGCRAGIPPPALVAIWVAGAPLRSPATPRHAMTPSPITTRAPLPPVESHTRRVRVTVDVATTAPSEARSCCTSRVRAVVSLVTNPLCLVPRSSGNARRQG